MFQLRKAAEAGAGLKWTERSFGGQAALGDPVIYHLRVAMTVGFKVGAWGRQGGGQRAGLGRDVVFVVIVRLRGSL